ncbi:DUF3139 domain-containing protein [Salirhabdus sp. Marseille-P4669]|uniref:DUF3139 domain-containing protein n=1 Tax=Salirhabdus sp. Marseille-P4669 TaxID=2042310 RepID=UPI000C7CBC7F|nr:DUF3139 domain-containing protein [Salirhabdus sp. Marseille-P4669]
MNKREKISLIISLMVIIIIVAIPVYFIYSLNNGNPLHKYITNKYIPPYLEEKGYTDTDFQEIGYVQPKHTINNDFYHGHYMVVFKDEPDTTYYYGVTKKGKEVHQFCEKDRETSDGVNYSIETGSKHSEETCINSLENR